MRVFANKYLLFSISIVIVMLFCCDHGFAASGTLHSASFDAFEKRAALANPDGWRFVFLGDNRGNDKIFKEALRRAAGFKPLFILHGGDIAEHGNAAELAHFLEMVRGMPDLPPIFVVRGNHEKYAGLYEETIGPRNFTIDSKRLGFRLVAVDNASYALEGKELDYLSKLLDRSRPVQVVSMHIPPKTERWEEHSFDTGKNELVSLMADRKVKLGLFAHIHMYDRGEINGIPLIISGGAGAKLTRHGSSGETSYHIVVIEVKNGKVSSQLVRL